MLPLGLPPPLGRALRQPPWPFILGGIIATAVAVVLTRSPIVAGIGAASLSLLGGRARLGRLWAWSREHAKVVIPVAGLLLALGLLLGDVWGQDEVEPFVARQRGQEDLTGEQLTSRFVTASNQVAPYTLRLWGEPVAAPGDRGGDPELTAATGCGPQPLPGGFQNGQLLPLPRGRQASQLERTDRGDLVDLSAGPFALPARIVLRFLRRWLPITPHRLGGRLSYSGDRAELTVYLTGGERYDRAGRKRWSVAGPAESIDEMIELVAVWTRLELQHYMRLDPDPLISALASRAVEDGAYGRAASFFALLTESDRPWGDARWLPHLAAVLCKAGREADAVRARTRYQSYREASPLAASADISLQEPSGDLTWSGNGLTWRQNQQLLRWTNGTVTDPRPPGEVSRFLLDREGSVLAVSEDGRRAWRTDGEEWEELSAGCALPPARSLRQYARVGSESSIHCLLDERGSLRCFEVDQGGSCRERSLPNRPAAARQLLPVGSGLFLLALDGGVWEWLWDDDELESRSRVSLTVPTRQIAVAAETGTIYVLYESGNIFRCRWSSAADERTPRPCSTEQGLELIDSGTGTRQVLVTPDDRYLYVLKSNGDLWQVDHPAEAERIRFERIFQAGELAWQLVGLALRPEPDGDRPTVYLLDHGGRVYRVDRNRWRFWKPVVVTPLGAAGPEPNQIVVHASSPSVPESGEPGPPARIPGALSSARQARPRWPMRSFSAPPISP